MLQLHNCWLHLKFYGIIILPYTLLKICILNTLRLRQNGLCFAEDTFQCIFLKENVRISIKISLNFAPKSPIDNIPALFQIMAWCQPGDKPLSEAMMVSLLTHICVALPQWVNPWHRWGTQNVGLFVSCVLMITLIYPLVLIISAFKSFAVCFVKWQLL